VRSFDAGDLVRVSTTPPGGADNGYGYSPDGSRILFARFDSTDTGTLFSVKPDGSDPVRLSPPALSVIDLGFFDRVGADWSPNGSRVAFAARKLSSKRFTTALFVVNADGSGLRQITSSGVGALSAQWSPNDALIAITSCCAFTSCCGLAQAWVVHPDGTGLRRVTTPVDRAVFWTPVWSPDSTKLLHNRQDRNNQTSLWSANTDGSELSKLTDTLSLAQIAWGSAPADLSSASTRVLSLAGSSATSRPPSHQPLGGRRPEPPEPPTTHGRCLRSRRPTSASAQRTTSLTRSSLSRRLSFAMFVRRASDWQDPQACLRGR
jgi:Tol biopolymer transport system component